MQAAHGHAFGGGAHGMARHSGASAVGASSAGGYGKCSKRLKLGGADEDDFVVLFHD